MSKFRTFFKTKRNLYGTLGVLTVLMIGFFFFSRGNGGVETISPQTGDIVRVVKIAGKVIPEESADLSFETGGIVSEVLRPVGSSVSRGEVLVRLDASTFASNLLKAEAELASARAELSKLEGGGVYEASIENAKRNLVQTIVEAYTSADDAIYNKTDQFFMNPRGGKPEIFYAFSGYNDLRDSINRERVLIGEMLDAWKTSVTNLKTESYSQAKLSEAKSNLTQISLFLSNVSRAVNIFEANDSVTQTSIDKYKSDTLLARESINRATQNLIDRENQLRNLLTDIPVQVARVESAEASVLAARSELSKTSLVSPIRGVVAKQDAKVGQVVSTGIELVSVIGRDYVVEAFVPEVSIGEIRIGNSVEITLDAYGTKEVFKARVSHIDPAETIRDGVSTYKVKLSFDSQDERIRSGMTANADIETFRKPEVTYIPERTVLKEGDSSFVYVLREGKAEEKLPVTLGERDSKGNVEILSELPLDIKIILNPSN